jgi:hypothetical protein
MGISSDGFVPSVPAKCHFCENFIKAIEDHEVDRHPPGEPLSTKYTKPTPKKPRGTAPMPINFIRLSDDMLERSSAFVEEDGNVIISAAQYKTLMSEAGWSQR